jgi:3D-(3,5/4)-trihydroxycyclohexane-1,2-dione acylhydrolase (decyclizing)
MSVDASMKSALAGASPSRGGALRLTTAQALVAYLSAQYSERDGQQRRLIPAIFGIFGHGNVVGLGQALEEVGADLPYFQGKNEQAMVHAAVGYAKASLRTQTLACAASVGPGATNMVTGAATASANRLPVLLLPADVYMRRRQDPVLQQIEHPSDRDVSVNDCFRPVSRFFDRITRPEQLLTSLPEAMRVLVDPVQTGAVTIALPQDVQGEAFDFPGAFFLPRAWPIVRRSPAEEETRSAIEIIGGSERPLLIAGGGVRYAEAEEELARLSSDVGIPVGETFAGKGCGPHDDLALGGIGATGTLAANRIAANADCVICVGTRLQDFTTGSQALFQHPDVRFVSINVDDRDAHKLGSTPVVGDARVTLARLREGLKASGHRTSEDYRAEVRREQAEWAVTLERDLASDENAMISQGQALRVLNRCTRAGDVIVTAAGTPPADVHRMWDTANGAECHIEFGFSCMGHEIPAAMGYRLARKDATGEIFVVIGDGTYLMGNSELVTCVQERLPITVMLIENGGYQAIRSLQVGKTGADFGNEFRSRDPDKGRLSGPLLDIDYVASARSLGCAAYDVSSLEDLAAAIDSSRGDDGPSVVIVKVEPHRLLSPTECFWDVGIAQTSSREQMRAIAAVHKQGQDTQRFYAHRPLDRSEQR